MIFTILDCYTDEPSGLGVPPYVGTYPRYIAGAIEQSKNDYFYLTIDDLRSHINNKHPKESDMKTNIKLINKSVNRKNTQEILNKTDVLIIISGLHTPGKYLSAYPGTISEVSRLIKGIKCFKLLTGPATIGSGLYGGSKASTDFEAFDLVVSDLEFKLQELIKNNFTEDVNATATYDKISQISVLGSKLLKQIDRKNIVAEIETAKGCSRAHGCSFCTEPLKNKYSIRPVEDVLKEIKELSKHTKYFRIGKQSDFFAHKTDYIEKLLKESRKVSKVLHIDNANPVNVTESKLKLVTEYCTEGNIAAFGVESFDPEVIKKNNLNTTPELVYEKIKLINKYGSKRGKNGMPIFLPGINIIFGLIGETKKTHEHNMYWLNKILKDGLLVRRINIREVVTFPGTELEKNNNKAITKNKKYYWKWRNEIRQNIDYPLIQTVIPKDTVLTDVYTEIHDGNTTFGRQLGTYPIVVGIKERLPLNKKYKIKIEKHMLRSITGKVI